MRGIDLRLTRCLSYSWCGSLSVVVSLFILVLTQSHSPSRSLSLCLIRCLSHSWSLSYSRLRVVVSLTLFSFMLLTHCFSDSLSV